MTLAVTVLRDYATALSQPALPLADERRPLRRGGRPGRRAAAGLEGDRRDRRRGSPPATCAAPTATSRALLADDGVTYARPGEGPGPWQLDPVPLLIDAASWAPLEVGLAQRAELLNAILVDLYGEQRLLAEGIIPPAVVLGHAGFTRVVARPSRDRPAAAGARGDRPRPRRRGPSGGCSPTGPRRRPASATRWRTGGCISRVLPELYREAGLHRMEPYFWALRSALLQSAQGDLADPRVVVLSPGTHSETAYDQAFVASALGFPLVQGSDLVVRDGWVWMRVAAAGLERVDVILRRVDAAWSDPLELRGDSQLGVAGLAEAVRRGRVRIVNGLGAGVLENPGAAALPAGGRARRCSASSCGWSRCRPGGAATPTSLDHVLARLDRLRGAHHRRAAGAGLARRRRELEQRILAAPHRCVGQERLPLSQAPTWGAGGRTSGVATPAR